MEAVTDGVLEGVERVVVGVGQRHRAGCQRFHDQRRRFDFRLVGVVGRRALHRHHEVEATEEQRDEEQESAKADALRTSAPGEARSR